MKVNRLHFAGRCLSRFRYLQLFTLTALIMCLFYSCVNSPSTANQQQQQQSKYTPPTIPTTLTQPKDRAEYMTLHYWDNFNFADTTLVGNANFTEQAFVDYIDLFPHADFAVAEKSIRSLLNKAFAEDSLMFSHFGELFEKYLYDPNSPFRQEDYYIVVLRTIVDNAQLDEILKSRPRYQLEVALKNRPGQVANDFEYTSSSGRSSRMSQIKSDYLLMFFNNPDCHNCAQVKEILTDDQAIKEMMSTNAKPSLKILAIYPDSDIELWRKTDYPKDWINARSERELTEQLYDLKAIPTLYLLDANKQVILKDATVEQIVQYLNNI